MRPTLPSILAFCLAFFASATAAQSQITAGQTANLIPTGKNIRLDIFGVNFPGEKYQYDSLDLDRDGKFDVIFGANVTRVYDYDGGGAFIGQMHRDFQYISYPNSGEPKQLQDGDPIDANQNWSKPIGNNTLTGGPLVSDAYGWGGHQQDGDWLQRDGYVGFRILRPGKDTLYGWLHLGAWGNNFCAGIQMNNGYIEPDLNVSNSAANWSTRPNPAAWNFTFNWPKPLDNPATLNLMSMTGGVAATQTVPAGSTTSRLDLSWVDSGVYTAILSGADFVWTKKVVVQRQGGVRRN